MYMCPLTIKNWCGTPQGDLLFKGVAQTLQAHTLQAHRVQESLDGMANGRRRLSGLRPQDPAEQGPGVDTSANPTTHE